MGDTPAITSSGQTDWEQELAEIRRENEREEAQKLLEERGTSQTPSLGGAVGGLVWAASGIIPGLFSSQGRALHMFGAPGLALATTKALGTSEAAQEFSTGTA